MSASPTALAAVLLALVLAIVMALLAYRQYRALRAAAAPQRLAHAFWMLLELGVASWLVSIAFWTLDGRQGHLPPGARPFVVLAVVLYLLAFAVRFRGGRWIAGWLANLPPRR